METAVQSLTALREVRGKPLPTEAEADRKARHQERAMKRISFRWTSSCICIKN